MTVATLNPLRRNDRAIIHWICNVKAKDEVSSDSLLSKLGIQDLDVVLRTSRMRWFGHVECRPKKTWDEVLMDDRKKLGMDSADPQNSSEWRRCLRGRLVKQDQPSVEKNRCNSLSCPPGQLAPRGASCPGISCPPPWISSPPGGKISQLVYLAPRG